VGTPVAILRANEELNCLDKESNGEISKQYTNRESQSLDKYLQEIGKGPNY